MRKVKWKRWIHKMMRKHMMKHFFNKKIVPNEEDGLKPFFRPEAPKITLIIFSPRTLHVLEVDQRLVVLTAKIPSKQRKRAQNNCRGHGRISKTNPKAFPRFLETNCFNKAPQIWEFIMLPTFFVNTILPPWNVQHSVSHTSASSTSRPVWMWLYCFCYFRRVGGATAFFLFQ